MDSIADFLGKAPPAPTVSSLTTTAATLVLLPTLALPATTLLGALIPLRLVDHVRTRSTMDFVLFEI
jgi:hypothetical protein